MFWQVADRFFAAGDGPFYFPGMLRELSFSPHLFDAAHDFGVNLANRFWYEYPVTAFIHLLNFFGLPWAVVDKILWFGAVLLLVSSAWYCIRKLGFSLLYSAVGTLVYTLNTYPLMIFGGGQYGVFLAYALASLVLGHFISVFNDEDTRVLGLKKLMRSDLPVSALFLSVLTAIDIRFGFMSVVILALYAIYPVLFDKRNVARGNLMYLLVTLVITAVVQSYWLLPLAKSAGGLGGEEYSGSGIVKFLSFADFSHSISLLHPNWPENIFGKVYFLQPEFLIIPIVAFAALFLLRKGKDSVHISQEKSVVFFSFMGVMGAFLTKGTNGPLGKLYTVLFENVPGFVMFRDPTKFYFLTALSYAFLIPYTLSVLDVRVSRIIRSKVGRSGKISVTVMFFLFWVISLRPFLLGQLTGNFILHSIPPGYAQIAQMLEKDKTFSRTLWIPGVERMAYATKLHPAVSGNYLFRNATASAIARSIAEPGFANGLADIGIKFIVVSDDVERKMYLSQYRFEESQKQILISALQAAGLKRVSSISGTFVYEIPHARSLITVANGVNAPYTFADDGSIMLRLPATGSDRLKVRYAYDPNWVLTGAGVREAPEKTDDGMMEFPVRVSGNSVLRLVYTSDRYANWGVAVSIITIATLTVWIGYMRLSGKRKD